MRLCKIDRDATTSKTFGISSSNATSQAFQAKNGIEFCNHNMTDS